MTVESAGSCCRQISETLQGKQREAPQPLANALEFQGAGARPVGAREHSTRTETEQPTKRASDKSPAPAPCRPRGGRIVVAKRPVFP